MHVLVTWGSKLRGTAGIGEIIAEELARRGFQVSATPVENVAELERFDAAVIGGALYANRWPGRVRRFVNRRAGALRRIPVWFFSSGPVDDAAARAGIPATRQVEVLAERIGAKGHVTFGGRLDPDAPGFPAARMAETMSGDRRDPEWIRAWAGDLAAELPTASPGIPIDHPAGSLRRLLQHAVGGWAVWTAGVWVLGLLLTEWISVSLGVFLAAIVFAGVGWRYFSARGAREPLPTAACWAVTAAVLHVIAITAPGVGRGLGDLGSLTRTWLPLAAVFLATLVVGELASTLPGSGSPTDRGET